MGRIYYPTTATVVGDHRLRLRFEDGLEGEIDFSDFRRDGLFAVLDDPTYFRQARIDHEIGALSWPNGADIAPDTLYHWVREGEHPAAA